LYRYAVGACCRPVRDSAAHVSTGSTVSGASSRVSTMSTLSSSYQVMEIPAPRKA
jgi:hypothetical protein